MCLLIEVDAILKGSGAKDSTIHADSDSVLLQESGKSLTCKPGALVSVEDIRPARLVSLPSLSPYIF